MDLYRATRKLDHLETFHFPHSGLLPPSPLTHFNICPPHVRRMYITGGLNFEEVTSKWLRWPSSLIQLSIRDCIHLSIRSFVSIFSEVSKQLQSLDIGEGMSRFRPSTLSCILQVFPFVHTLKISNDYISQCLYWPPYVPYRGEAPLAQLELTCFGRDQASPWEWIWHLVIEQVFPNLRQILVYRNAPWVEPVDELEDEGHYDEPPRIDESSGGIWVIPGPFGSVEYSVIEVS